MIIEKQITSALGLEDADIVVPKLPEHGEFSTNIAMKLAKKLNRNPHEIAREIVEKLDFTGTFIAKAEVAGSGFINFTAKNEWYKSIPREVVMAGENWGSNNILKGEKICLEYVSANPTGPMHMGNARGGALGDSQARIMEACGAEVIREFYINDAGNQIEKLKQSLDARFHQLQGMNIEFSDDLYQGQDIIDYAQFWLESGNSTPDGLVSYAVSKNVEDMKNILSSYNITYDVWFSENSLYEHGAIDSMLQRLRENGRVYKKGGAVWLKTNGDEKDEVLVRDNGIPTYFAADIAYHYNKFVERGFTKVVNVWGADHGGHVPRMKAAMECLGIDPKRLEIIIIQLVRLVKDGNIARMSKRKGDTISLGELIDEIGVDSARFFFNMRNANSAFDFDLDLAVKQSSDNPVFYVQYAHARICSILEQSNITPEDICEIVNSGVPNGYDYNTPQERALIREIALYPRELAIAARKREPSNITTYVRNLASAFHAFYSTCKVNVKDDNVRYARLMLVQATRQTIKNALDILGVSAPERMAKLDDELHANTV